jgi:Cu-Zn family superoxide dismutase
VFPSRQLPRVGAIVALASFLLIGATGAYAQGTPVAATPEAPSIEAAVMTADGTMVGKVEVARNEDGVTFTVLLDAGALPEGEHGMHVHETGSCAQGGDSAFALANAHYNPTDQHHGAPNADTSHGGDLGNLIAAADGSADFTITVTTVSLDPSATDTLLDADGSALIIHTDADDLKTDPSGDSGDRVLCAVLSPDTGATPVASPAAMPMATPAG